MGNLEAINKRGEAARLGWDKNGIFPLHYSGNVVLSNPYLNKNLGN